MSACPSHRCWPAPRVRSAAMLISIPALALTACEMGVVPAANPAPMQAAGDRVALTLHVANTDGASGIAIRPSDGALFALNRGGIFGPLKQGDDLSAMSPIGATNLADASIFNGETTSLVLAITNGGEFWIGSQCCSILAIVPAAGGDAAPFEGLLAGTPPSNIKPETFALVPTGFDGSEMKSGNLLAGQDTTFSRLAAMDVDGNRDVVNVANPTATNREAIHLAFSPGPVPMLFSSRGALSPDRFGIQTIDTQGRPTGLPGTINLSAKSFVVLANGDIVLRGSQKPSGQDQFDGILIWQKADESVVPGLALPVLETSEDDELIATADRSMVFLALPNRNQIYTVTILE